MRNDQHGFAAPRWRGLALALLVLGVATLLAGCGRDDADKLRASMEKWFSLGDTLHFKSTMTCTAALYRVTGDTVSSRLDPQTDIDRAVFGAAQRRRLVLANTGMTPDQAFVAVMNADRGLGVAIQGAGLEGKNCMDERTISALHFAMKNPDTVMVFDPDAATLVLMDPGTRLVIVAGGDA